MTLTSDAHSCRDPAANNVDAGGDLYRTAALDFLRCDAIVETADTDAGFADKIADAAEHGQHLKLRVYASLMARAATALLQLTATIGHAQVQS
jgi:hypothetical protein